MSTELSTEQLQQVEIEALKSEIAALKAKTEEDKISTAVREAAAVAHAKPAPTPSATSQNLQRSLAVAAVGGNSFWAVLPLDRKLAALGLPPASSSDVETALRLFGPNSSSLEAARLARQNPAQYARLRAVYRES
jgi:hypothetical protein